MDFYSYNQNNNLLLKNTLFIEIKRDVKLWSDFEDFHNTFLDYLESKIFNIYFIILHFSSL